MTAIHDLIKSLHGADSEASDLAFDLSFKAHGEINPSAPTWHPSHPEHPWRDAWQDQGHEMWHPTRGQVGYLHPLADRAAATQRAHEWIDAYAHPEHKEWLHARLNGEASLGRNPDKDPMHPSSPNHGIYLANPGRYHEWSLHDVSSHGLPDDARTDHLVNMMSSSPGSPSHPDNPDYLHFTEAHSRIKVGSPAPFSRL